MRAVILAISVGLPASAWAQTTICVDAGHGGRDPGAVGCGFEEEDIVVDTSIRLRDLLQTEGYRVVMTRVDDTAVSLAARASLANSEGAARFMSIHANSAASVATGIETFCSNSASGAAVDLRDRIQSAMISTWPLRDRGGKRANFSVLVNTSMPATLTELGFINNCGVDVTYLTDPNERQRAARAHLDALVANLGGTPPPMTGTLTGVVFEDRGQGLADTSVRIAGATVTVQETSDVDTSAVDTGAWRFELTPGSYTVLSERDGFAPTARTCDVLAGDVTWCSIGLFADSTQPDAGVVDAGHVDAGNPDRDAGSAERDAGTGDGAAAAAPDAGTPAEDDEGCACTTKPGGNDQATSFGLLVVLALLFFGARSHGNTRRIGAAVAIVMVLAVPEVNAEWKVGAAERVARDLHRPRIAPDAKNLLATDARMHTIAVVALGDPAKTVILERPRAGYRPVWAADGRRFGVRASRRPFSGEPLLGFDLSGRFVGPIETKRRVRQDDGVVSIDGRPLTVEGRAFAPVVDPTGRFVVFETLTRGLFLHRIIDARTFALGRGTSPAFSADGEVLVFERTSDDGHQITTSGLYALKTNDARVELLLDDAGQERFPTISGPIDGGYVVAFEKNGTIWTSRITESDR